MRAVTARRRLFRWLMFALACFALGASAVPARAQAQVDVAAQVALLKREAARAPSARAIRRRAQRWSRQDLRAPASELPRRAEATHLPGPPGRIYLRHLALLR